jgi:hypothetical protein
MTNPATTPCSVVRSIIPEHIIVLLLLSPNFVPPPLLRGRSISLLYTVLVCRTVAAVE